MLVASVLANVRNQIALLFRDLGTDNVFAFHLTGDPYVTANEREARRRPLELEFVADLKRLSTAALDVGAQIIVPTTTGGEVLVARAGGRESDTVLVEGATPTLFDIIGAEFARGRPFTDLEDRQQARVAVIGAALSEALFGNEVPIGRTLTLGGETYTVVGELARRRGGFLGENRQDNVLTLPAGTVRSPLRRAGARGDLRAREAWTTRGLAFRETEAILRQLRQLAARRGQRFQPLDRRSDHRDLRRPQRAHRPGDRRPRRREPAHRRHRNRQRDVHQRDGTHAGDWPAHGRRRAAQGGSACSSCWKPCSSRAWAASPASRRRSP